MTRRQFLYKLFYIFEKVHCHVMVLFSTPGFLIFEMSVVRPALIEIYKPGIAKQCLHIFLCMFCFINVTGNMMMSIYNDGNLKNKRLKPTEGGDYCKLCETYRPPKAWHCKRCNVCIFRRDHHCFFFSRCIGLYNRRYYLLYLAYMNITMIYSSYYNYYFVSSKFKDLGFFLAVLRILNPVLRFFIPEPMATKDLYVLLFLFNVGLIAWSAVLFRFHMRNTIRGVTAHEHRDPAKNYWKDNLISVFGRRWYFAIVWPFVDSAVDVETNKEY